MHKSSNNILIVNPGSTSKKYALFRDGKNIASAHYEHTVVGFRLNLEIGSKLQELVLKKRQYVSAVDHVLSMLVNHRLIVRCQDIDRVVVRVVVPGSYFTKHREVDRKFISKLKNQQQRAELHVTALLEELREIREVLPKVEILGVSDSAFHQGRSAVSEEYAISYKDTKKFDIYRYGYHGLSVESVILQLTKLQRKKPSRVIVCHLGGGASVTAVKNGKSLETSMGFTPLEGLVMSGRSGDIDPVAAVYLAQKKGFNYKELEHYLNYKSGLVGLSNASGDIRKLLSLEKGGHKRARVALDSFIYRIKQYIGSYAALMNGLDVLVFTATIGERSSIIRQRICDNLDFLGIKIDESKNKKLLDNENVLIGDNKFKVKIVVIQSDEVGAMYEIAQNI